LLNIFVLLVNVCVRFSAGDVLVCVCGVGAILGVDGAVLESACPLRYPV